MADRVSVDFEMFTSETVGFRWTRAVDTSLVAWQAFGFRNVGAVMVEVGGAVGNTLSLLLEVCTERAVEEIWTSASQTLRVTLHTTFAPHQIRRRYLSEVKQQLTIMYRAYGCWSGKSRLL